MPEISESADEKALIDRMASSNAFKGVKGLADLLAYLYGKRDSLLTAADIEADHYRRDGQYFDPNHARERVSKLRERIAVYHAERPDETLRLELPRGDDAGGYRLVFNRVVEAASACRRFWAAHLDSGKASSLICDPLLFYFDFEGPKAFRFMDTNIEGTSREAAKAELLRLHEGDYHDRLIPGHLYIDIGSIEAAEAIRQYFRKSEIDLPLVLDKERKAPWLEGSPILIGNVRTSFSTRDMFRSGDTKDFAYRLVEDRFAWVHIEKPSPEEIAELKSIDTEISERGDFLTPRSEITIGIVTRMRNPHGAGAMTFIASDGTYTTRQIAAALTDESQMRAVFHQMKWRLDRPAPEKFEMMFLVTLWPGGMSDKGAQAKLLCFRA